MIDRFGQQPGSGTHSYRLADIGCLFGLGAQRCEVASELAPLVLHQTLGEMCLDD